MPATVTPIFARRPVLATVKPAPAAPAAPAPAWWQRPEMKLAGLALGAILAGVLIHKVLK